MARCFPMRCPANFGAARAWEVTPASAEPWQHMALLARTRCQVSRKVSRKVSAISRAKFGWFIAGLIALFGLGSCASRSGHPWIHKIVIDGARQVKPRAIRGKLAIEQASWIPFSPKHYLEHPYLVEVEAERIDTYYRARGFYSAHVTNTEVVPYRTGEKPAVDLHYTVVEGSPTRVRRVELRGLDALGEDGVWIKKRIGRAPALRPGEIFEYPEYLIAKDDMKRALQLRGYAFAKVECSVQIDRDQLTADVTIDITPRKKGRIGQIFVEGNKIVDPALIARHTGLTAGVEFRPELLSAAQGKLYNLGIFTTVLVDAVENPSDPQLVDVKISVAEGKFRELNLGVGFGIEPMRTEVHGSVTFLKRNLYGGLRKFEVSLRPGYAAVPAFWSSDLSRHGPVANLRVELTQPDLLGRNSEIAASLVYDLGLEYAYQYHGPGVRLGAQRAFWRNQIKVALSYHFQFLDFFAADPAILSDPGGSGARYGYTDPYRLAYLQEQVVLDLRNRPIDATRGFMAGLTAEQGGIYTGSAFDYQKLLAEARGYLPLGSRVVIAAHLQFGQIFVQSDFGSPITQRLYLGGPNSHRGFTYNRLSYQVCSARYGDAAALAKIDCLTDSETEGISEFRRLPIGGDQMVMAQIELRLNLFKLARQWFSFAAFMDAGDVAAPAAGSCRSNACDSLPYLSGLDLSKLHVAVGGGLRYRTVVGAIRFDLGVRLNRLGVLEDGVQNPDPGQRFAYHISIGEAF